MRQVAGSDLKGGVVVGYLRECTYSSERSGAEFQIGAWVKGR
jgi:hypothetical protein